MGPYRESRYWWCFKIRESNRGRDSFELSFSHSCVLFPHLGCFDAGLVFFVREALGTTAGVEAAAKLGCLLGISRGVKEICHLFLALGAGYRRVLVYSG
jgi:hypothetical protein